MARFAVPLRIGLALSTTGWVQENILDRFNNRQQKKDQGEYMVVEDDDFVGGDEDGDGAPYDGYDSYYGYDPSRGFENDNSFDEMVYGATMKQLSGDYQKRLITRR